MTAGGLNASDSRCIDSLMGGGIRSAVLSAQVAAPLIISSLAHGKVKLEDYHEAMDDRIMSELRIARVPSRLLMQLPHLAFGMFHQSEAVWKTVCDLMLGEIDYAAIKRSAGGFKGTLRCLLGAWHNNLSCRSVPRSGICYNLK